MERVREEGVSLPQVACLARCNGAVARVVRPPPFEKGEGGNSQDDAAIAAADESESESEAARAAVAEAEAEFRAAVLAACRGGPEAIVASYTRKLVAQTGDGHFSPIGAFDETTDSVLVLDVARFKYSPHWLPLKALVRAMRPLDAATGRPRGWMGVRAAPAPRSVLFTLEAGNGNGGGASAAAAARVFGETTLPELFRSSSSDDDASSLVARAAAAAPLAAVAAFVGLRAPSAAAAAETAAAAAALAAANANGEGGTAAAAAAAPHACGSEADATADGAASACAIPDAAAALLAELEAWPALRAVRGALDGGSHFDGAGGCSARSSAAASVAGRADVAHAAAVAAREQQELESYGLLPERLALLLAAAAPSAEGGGESSPASSPPAWPEEARKLLTPPPGSVLAAEVSYLRAQWKELPALDAASAASAKAAGKAGGCGCGV